ncbi:virulence RhuM family protein [Coraliomargarita algicola]|uniref:Virulence RhuM family protein n=1 Tax=Coraliomargarita algicola TaxID=3092156 RepID=A0ABZ0RJS4_9BACT|nr:virulence RhuM family protein [Coraliomargarita sp. J2-16]WPJ95230.1 virulence RhuM family protein [Coraliomargarita sp. J2-16]
MLILYTTEDGKSQIQLRADQDTVWLSQRQMAELFDVSTDNIGLHLKNIYADEELTLEATTEESSVVQKEGNREVKRPLTLYNLDAILAVGYRVRSPRGVQFRRWASTVLKEYLLKGFAMDDERLKNPDGRPDHFDEMLERIRDIRASEKRFYQKVRDLFALSSDYDKSDRTTQQFFATVQNLLLFAVTQKTAAELVTARANPEDSHFGLLTWKDSKVRKADIVVAKNYLSEDEIDTLNRLVVIFLETAELRAKMRKETQMHFWKENVDQIISSNGFPLLTDAGSISHKQMEQSTSELYLRYDQQRRAEEARQADLEDEAELKALENKLKNREFRSEN